MLNKYFYRRPGTKLGLKPNRWDVLAFVILLGVGSALASALSDMHTPYQTTLPAISLSPWALLGYAVNTILRMFIALFFSFLFTFIIAPIAAKNRQAEKLLLPLIDILQSIPILGLLSITVAGFRLFPDNRLGPECASIFAIFTSQVWNMTLSFYQSLKTTPKEFYETSAMFHLSSWQQFWCIEVPYAIPGLLWNTMISMSVGWFFVVASEAISVVNQNIMLPGIGSYISVAIANANISAIFYAIIAMLLVILLYDQLFFRPLLTWANRFNGGQLGREEASETRAWFYTLLVKTRVLKYCSRIFDNITEFLLNFPGLRLPVLPTTHLPARYSQIAILIWDILLGGGVIFLAIFSWRFVSTTVPVSEMGHVFYLGAITALKVTVLIILATLIWVPVGVWMGLHPSTARFMQPLLQFLAAFPINLVYPLAVTGILYFHLNVQIWTTPLMILGTQWYILFNVIAGTVVIPQEFFLVAKNFGLTRWLWWKRLALPAIFPYTITGCMTAAAGCWNASIISEVLVWGNHRLVATGLGSYIAENSTKGDFPRIVLGITMMCCYVLVINHLVWRRLYNFSASRFTLE